EFTTTSEDGRVLAALAHAMRHESARGEYSTHELGIQPEAYDPKLGVDFTQLRDQNLRAEGFGTAA
ncbi:hypothetical protein ACFRLW_49120, partial [Streptomyces sp. NPDC056728]